MKVIRDSWQSRRDDSSVESYQKHSAIDTDEDQSQFQALRIIFRSRFPPLKDSHSGWNSFLLRDGGF
jgi:hypothetical protein